MFGHVKTSVIKVGSGQECMSLFRKIIIQGDLQPEAKKNQDDR